MQVQKLLGREEKDNVFLDASISRYLCKKGVKGTNGTVSFPFLPHAAAAAKSLQSCPTLCNPMDGSPRGSPVPRILQARTLEWVAISFSNAWKWKVKVKSFSHIWLLATPWTAAYQARPSMGFSRQEYGVGCHCLLRSCLIPTAKWKLIVQRSASQ